MKDELFGLELNEEGIYWLSKFRVLAAIILAATIIVNGLNVYTTLPYMIKANDHPFELPARLRLMNTLSIFNMLINFVLQAIQVIFYYRFAAFSNRAITEQNHLLLNQSFKWLYFQAITLVVHLSISFVYFVYSYFTRPV